MLTVVGCLSRTCPVGPHLRVCCSKGGTSKPSVLHVVDRIRSPGVVNRKASKVSRCHRGRWRQVPQAAHVPGAGLGDAVPPKNTGPALLRFFGFTLLVVCGTFISHPLFLQLTVTTLDLTPSNGVETFETSFFGLITIIYGLLVGNSFLFLYERQTLLVQELYHEVFAIELLLQQTLLLVTDNELRSGMVKGIRKYVSEEIYCPTDMESPFSPDSSFMQLVGIMARVKQADSVGGDSTLGMVQALEKLADAQSRRSAVAVQLLPGMHWVFLHMVESIFLITLLAFQAAHLNPDIAVPHERQLAFAALCGFLTLTSQMLYDINEPLNGLYGFRDSLDQRMRYVDVLLASMVEASGSGQLSADDLEGEKRMQTGLQQLRDLGMMDRMSNMTFAGARHRNTRPTRQQPQRRPMMSPLSGSIYALGTMDSDSDADDSEGHGGSRGSVALPQQQQQQPLQQQEQQQQGLVGMEASSPTLLPQFSSRRARDRY